MDYLELAREVHTPLFLQSAKLEFAQTNKQQTNNQQQRHLPRINLHGNCSYRRQQQHDSPLPSHLSIKLYFVKKFDFISRYSSSHSRTVLPCVLVVLYERVPCSVPSGTVGSVVFTREARGIGTKNGGCEGGLQSQDGSCSHRAAAYAEAPRKPRRGRQ